jgi:predicted peptidase
MLVWTWIALMPTLTLSLANPDSQPASAPAALATGFLYRSVTIESEKYAYCVYVPPEYTPDKPWPVILFLHGSGERGDDGFLQTEIGIGRALRRNYRMIPAIVVMPQCRPNQPWVGPMAVMALRCLEETSREYHLDPQRVYLTGLSLGGHGAWNIAAELPGRFAALLIICGFADLGESTGEAARLAARLTNVPIWCFHGQKDDAVPVQKAREMVAAIKAAGGKIEYVEYPDGTHGIWDRVYDNREVWRWLFEQRRE